VLEAFIVFKPETAEEERIPVGSRLVIGRTADCGLILEDPAASRHHLEIRRENDEYRFRDLGSTNGTLVNGVRREEGVLKPGDRLQIGQTELVFEIRETADSTHDELLNRTVLDLDRRKALAPDESKAADLLKAMYAVSNEITTTFDLCELVDRILETTMRAVDGQRGALYFGDSETGELRPCPVCKQIHVITEGRLERYRTDAFRMSRSVARRVLLQGQSILYEDTADKRSLPLSESIETLRLRSIICVPLRGKYGVLGVLYMDTDRPDRRYTRDDLLLSTAVGVSAGLALENARFYREILEKKQIEQEIEYAWAIQQGFLPESWPSEAERFDVFGCTKPARTVGGDFYDYLIYGDGRLGLLIGDVSGKGVPAALTMAQILAEFRLVARLDSSPARIVDALNRSLFRRSKRGMFATLLVLILDPESREAVWANAGHLPPLYLSGDGPRHLPEATGPPAGVLPEGPWEDQRENLSPGDTVLLYTDGVMEARPAGSKSTEASFGREKLAELAAELAGLPAKRIVEGISEAVFNFCAPDLPHDDVTLIAARIRP